MSSSYRRLRNYKHGALFIAIVYAVVAFSLGFSPSEKLSKSATSSSLPQEKASVTRVVDGDTFIANILGTDKRIRIIGIDTPETVDPRKPVQCFGREASDELKAILQPNEKITLVSDPSQDDRDKYGRLLRYAFLSDGTDIGKAMIAGGFAHEYTYYLPYAYEAEYKAAEASAKQRDLGLWSPKACAGKP